MSSENLEVNDRKAENFVKKWLEEISDAEKREKRYRRTGRKCVEIYEGKKVDETPFAILYSNTETLFPAVYSQQPIPVVSRRYKDADPVGKAVAETSTRVLKYLLDTEDKDYDTFDGLMQPAVLDTLITNRGLTRFRYVAKEGGLPECAYGEAVRWDKFLHGYARTWKKVPWVGFEWDMSKDELKKNFPDAPFDDLRKMVESSGEDEDNESSEDKEEMAGVRTYKVYEIWDKKSRQVIFISPCCHKQPLRKVDDPLGLSSFFPIPRPMNFMKKVTTLVPTPLYVQYQQQAQEINEITRRLKAIIKAIRFRGAYNAAVEGIDKMLEAEDNQLVPVENVQSMPDGTGMDKLLWTVPVNDLVQTAQSLYQQRESCKQVIYEITGVSDILRGASVASETATAQNIKNQWGTLRLKRMQKEVQRYCRDALTILLEIAANKFEIETLQQMTGLPFMTVQQKQQVQQQQALQAQQMPPPQPGQPPAPPPQLPPEIAQPMALPSWEDIAAVLQNNVALHYKTDIETNSTIDAEAAQDKQDISDLLNAISQFLNGVGPLVEQGTLPVEVAKEMLLVISRRFNFGEQLEDSINLMKPPEPKADPAADAKAQAEQAKAAAEKAKAEAEMKQTQMEAGIAEQEFQARQAERAQEAELRQLELQIKREEMELQRQGLADKAAFQRESARIKLMTLQAQAALKAAEPKKEKVES